MIISALLWLKTRLYFILGLLSVAAAAVISIRQSGKQAERVDAMKDTLKAVKKKSEVEREVDRNPDGDAAKRLRDVWSRD